MNYRSFQLLQMHVNALYIHDADDRLLRVNESDLDEPTPRFFLARTMKSNLWRTRYNLQENLAIELDRLAASEPVADDLRAPLYHGVRYVELLEQHAPISDMNAGPAYYLPELEPSNNTVTITPENMNLLRANYPYTLSILSERIPIIVVVADGMAVAACYTVRSTSQVAEAGVYTMEMYRKRGYAAEVVRSWAAAIQTTGRVPLYSTSWTNTASQAVAMTLGAVQYGIDHSFT